jgi:FMN phosphatase YigB (HAD superfamily)
MIFADPVEQLLIDLDGTLLGNRALSLRIDFLSRAYSELKKKMGIREATRLLFGLKRQLSVPSLEKTNYMRLISEFSTRLNVSFEQSQLMLRDLITLIFPPLKKHFYPIPGAKEFLYWAKDHYPLVLATNPVWPKEIIELRVEWAGIDPSIFQFVTHVDQMHACKPDKEYYEEILVKRNLSAERCILVGDNLKMDLPAARAGIRVFIVGDYKRIDRLNLKGAKALACRGSFALLRKNLEDAQ